MPPEGCDIVLGAASLFRIIKALDTIAFVLGLLVCVELVVLIFRR